MQLNKMFQTKPLFEILLAIFFVFFLLFPIMIPTNIANFIESSLGIIVLLSIAILFFVYANIAISLLFVLVAYELIRRSSKSSGRFNDLRYSPSQNTRDNIMQSLNSTAEISLEEEMVSRMTPVLSTEFIESTYKSVYDDDHHAFKLN